MMTCALSSQASREPMVGRAQNGKLKVLVVDDSEFNCRLLCRQLTAFGCEASAAANGQEAVDAVRQESFDLIFMDQNMPVLDGNKATKIIRTELPNPPVIIGLTGTITSTSYTQARAAGMTLVFAKPIEPQKLEKLLDTLKSKSAANSKAPSEDKTILP